MDLLHLPQLSQINETCFVGAIYEWCAERSPVSSWHNTSFIIGNPVPICSLYCSPSAFLLGKLFTVPKSSLLLQDLLVDAHDDQFLGMEFNRVLHLGENF